MADADNVDYPVDRHAVAVFRSGVRSALAKCNHGRRQNPREVAALYVDVKHGPYAKLEDVDAWGVKRDATKYRGEKPVVAHPACGPWGRFWWRYTGKEGSAAHAIRAVRQVRKFGGVVEHPRNSNLWDSAERYQRSVRRSGLARARPKGLYDLPFPGDPPDRYGGYTIEVNQVDWGHPALKPTWLYIVGVPPNRLPPRPPPRQPVRAITTKGKARGGLRELSKSQRHVTPPAFAAWLVEVARRAATGVARR